MATRSPRKSLAEGFAQTRDQAEPQEGGQNPAKSSYATFTVFTIGHSNRSLEDFVALLKTYDIQCVADVRTVPRSRHNPQFNKDTLPQSLQEEGITYVHLGSLGGLRHARKDSTNLGWRNASFRGFADYMETPEFKAGVEQLLQTAKVKRTALMCAEAVPWRCHRSLIADALTARHIPVRHIVSAAEPKEHSMTPFAQVTDERVTYPASEPLLEAQNN